MRRAVIHADAGSVERKPRGRCSGLASLLLVLALTAPARAQEAYDPFEPVNRAIFSFNLTLDRFVIEPVARGYRFVAPQPVRNSITNFLANLRSPVIFANDLLQGERDRAGVTLGRFMINSSLGVLGLFDAASAFGYKPHSEDMGQTFGVWGAPAGPYLMLPILGPSNLRDATGRVGDYFINPLNHCCIDSDERYLIFGMTGISEREANIEAFEDLKKNSLDLYAAVRSIYTQSRAAEIANGAPTGNQQQYDEIFQDHEE